MKNFLRLGKSLLGVFALILVSGNLIAQDTKLDFTGVGTLSKYEGCEYYVVTFTGTYSGSKSIAKAELLDPIIAVGQNDWDNQTATTWTKNMTMKAGTYNPTFRITFTDNTFQNAALSKPIVVYSNPRPNLQIDGNEDQCLESNKYCFLNTSVEGENVTTNKKNKIIKYQWDFGDGGGSEDFEPCYSYKTGGRQFDISLSVTDEKGCIGDTIIRKYPNVYDEIGAKYRVRVNNPTGAGCPVADVTFFNQSKLDTALVQTWIWDWGIGKRFIDTFSADSANHWDEWWTDFDKKFSQDGWISPKLVIITKDSCRDSFILKNAFQVVNYDLAFTWTPDTQCFAGNNVTFRMKPRPNAQAFLWTFGDPNSMRLNFDDESWSPSHKFVDGPGWYNVTLSILESPCPVRDTTICFIKLKGPGVAITLPNPPFPPHSCVEPREIPIEDFERLKYDACYRESYEPSGTQYVGIMPSSTLNPLNEVPIEQGYIRWVEVDDTLIEMDSFFVYCNADTQWSYDINGDTFFNIDTIKNKPGTDNANGNAIVTPRLNGVGSVGCNDYHLYDGTLVRAIVLNRGENYKPGTYKVIFTDDSANTNDGKGRVVINQNGTLDSVYIDKGGSGYSEFDDTARLEFVDPTAVGGNGKLNVIAIANDDVYVSDTLFRLVPPDPGVNGEWRITSSQKWVQKFQPIWNYQDPIPVKRVLKVKDYVKPIGGGAAVVKEFTIFHPFIRTHKVNIGGTAYTYRPPSEYKVEYIDGNGDPQTYYPPMYRGTSPINPFPTDQCSDNFETMHDTDLFNCTGPNLVTFTSHVSKYRLFDRGGTDMPPHPLYSTTNQSHAFLGSDNLIDSCKQNSNVPWGTDSVTYFWDFGDGDPCSMVVRNGKVVAVDQSGLLPLQDPTLCQYSNMAAPKHLFVDDDCYSPRLTVYDPVTDCQAVSSVNIVNRGPDAGPGEPGGPLTIYDVNSYNQAVLKDDNGDDIRMGAQVGRTDAPCAANSFNQYFQNIDVGETEPTCGKEDYWMVFDAKNDCTNNDCVTESNGQLFVIKILDGGSLYAQGSYNVTFRDTSGTLTTPGKGIAVIGRLGNLQKVVITDPGSGFTDQDTAYLEFDDSTSIQGNGALKVLALSVKENYYRNGVIQEVEIKQRGAFYNPGTYDVYFPYKKVSDSAYGKVTVGSLGFVESIQMLSYGSGYPKITDSIWMEFADPAAAGGNCKVRIAALPVERNYYASCPWIPKLVIEMILGNRWSYSTPGWKDIGMVIKVGDCFDTFFYENYKYIIDANGDFLLSPNPMTYDDSDTMHVIESGREFTSTLSANPCNMPRRTAKTQLPTRLPMDITLSVREDTRNDPNKLTNDSIKKFQYFIQYVGDQCGEEPFKNVASVKLGKFRDDSSYREDTIFGQCGGKDQLGDTALMNLYDTSTFTFRAPGKYSYTTTAESKFGISVCAGGAGRQIWFGQFQCFTVSDPIVCGTDTVEFRDSVHYWQDQSVCDFANDFNNKTCIDRTLFFYAPDSNAKRRAWWRMPDYEGPRYREALAWDFNAPRFRTDTLGDTIKVSGKPVRMEEWQRKLDSTDIEVWVDMDTFKSIFGRRLFITQNQRDQRDLYLAGDSAKMADDSLLHIEEEKYNSARYVYGDNLGVGAYDVTLWARDSMGCWTPKTIKDAVKVVGVQADFIYENPNDDVRVCVPQIYKFRNHSLIYEPNGTDTIIGVEKNDSVVKQEWWFGEEFGTNRDTSYLLHPQHTYLKIDTFTISLVIETYQGCRDTLIKENYVKLIGPRLDSAFSIREDTGCVSFRVLADVPVPDGNRYALQWELGDGNQTSDNDFNRISRLDYNNVGRFPLFLNIFDTIVNNGDTNLCYDRLPRTQPEIGEDTIWVTVLGLDSIAANLSNHDICPGDEVTLRIDADNQFAKYDTLFWSAGEKDNSQIIFGDTVLADVGSKISFENPGKYWVKLSGNGDWPICPTDAYDTIRVKEALADVEIDETNVKDSLLANFNFLNKSLPANAYKWEIYELPSMTLIDEFERLENDTSDLRYDKFGKGKGDQKAEYLIVLTATVSSNDNDPNPCISSDSVRVVYNPKFDHFNVFTPNDDGKNDYFALDLEGAIEYKITIYNRWGEVINRVTDEDEVSCVENENSGNMTCAFWDGTNFRTGSKAASGTYYYLFEYKYKGDEDDADMRKHRGTITLLR